MAVISNREAYLASEPEMDITQFHKTALDLKYADESENQILDLQGQVLFRDAQIILSR